MQYNPYQYHLDNRIYAQSKKKSLFEMFNFRSFFILIIVTILLYQYARVKAEDKTDNSQLINEIKNVHITEKQFTDSYSQYEDVQMSSSLEEIQKVYEIISTELQNNKLDNLEQLNNLHEKKILLEEQYYESIQKQIDEHYGLLKDKYVLMEEKKELEKKLKHVNDNIDTKNNKLYESIKLQKNTIESKAYNNKNLVEHEKLVMDQQNELTKKLI